MESKMGVLFQDKPNAKGQYSANIQNPGEEFFLKLAAHSVRVENQTRENKCIYFARKALLQCGLGLNYNIFW